MINYAAYTRVKQVFATFEDAVTHLESLPGAEDKEIIAVSILTDENSYGATVQLLDGLPTEVISTAQAYIVTVSYEVLGKTFTFEYMVEFGLKPIPEPEPEIEEEIENGEDSVESGLGGEEVDPESDEGSGEVGEEPGISD